MAWLGRLLADNFPSDRGGRFRQFDAAETGADYRALENIKGKSMPHTETTDAAIARHMIDADAAANSTGASFRESMRKISELQSGEIERLRAIVADVTAERPRKLISITGVQVQGDGEPRPRARIVGLANDGSLWTGNAWGRDWERCADLPQATDELND
ncbi:hypothetical protein [Acidiphilium acidophilum]|uniref:hypothetical protein n=1 Tax=Acidiphilium acidophilum TaxID=76588 RepID=UPI002E8E6C49|nr:hypothetical protein [Acidiphilium acidophilum]